MSLSLALKLSLGGNLTTALDPVETLSGIVLSSDTVDVAAPVGTVVGSFTAIGGVPPFVFTLTSNPGSYFRIDDDRDLVVDAMISADSPTPASITLGVQVEDGQ